MSRLDSYSGKVMDLVGQVGDSLRTSLPDSTGKWLQTGAALGVAKTGTRVVGSFIRRNPAVAVAAAVGAGALWFLAHRHRARQQAEGEVIEGKARRIEPRRSPRKAAPRRSSRTKTSTDE
ncbi:hypothetical protein FZO89_09775 [Luteimonas viscosa]|uniref:Uncharacterized protein n=1 Tax=Luteimonas viscosa TaxID=1132694 RepID=A0A5D4XR45_9GAMM|nr:hypothetical protein [Luteimonas viscosa]TYT26524.1 hypothetical protein FZO89_09775 [Luteimonas viscosa]